MCLASKLWNPYLVLLVTKIAEFVIMLVKLYITLPRWEWRFQIAWFIFHAILWFCLGFNILFSTDMQVVRGDFIIFFNKIFDALCKLSADSDANVQSAAHLLDRLVKVNKCSLPLSIHWFLISDVLWKVGPS